MARVRAGLIALLRYGAQVGVLTVQILAAVAIAAVVWPPRTRVAGIILMLLVMRMWGR